MWRTSKKDYCLRTILLFINCIACVGVIYIYITYVGNQETRNIILSENLMKPEKLTDKNCTPVCDSRDCIWYANMLLKTVDSTADPCEDFLSFLCGGFREKIGPGDKGNVIKETDSFLINKLKGILDNIQAKPRSALAKMKTVYDSCVNYGSSELQGLKELQNFLKMIGISNWPNLSPYFNFSGIDLPTILGHFIAFSAEDMFYVMQASDEYQEDQLKAEKNHLMVLFNDYRFDRIFGVPHELAVSILKYFDLAAKDRDMIIKSHRLVKYYIMKAFNESTYVETCPEVQCPDFYIHCPRRNKDDWHYFCQTLDVVLNFSTVIEPTNTSIIEVSNFQRMFLIKIFRLLRTFPKRMLANFIDLSFIKGYQAELNFYFRFHKLKHKDFEQGFDTAYYELGRREYCTRWIAKNMHIPLVNEFYHQYLASSITEELINIYKNYSSEVMDLVAFQDWIPIKLKSRILDKLKNANFNIDTLGRLFPDDSFADKFYEKFLPSRDSFFSNALELTILSNILVPSSFLESELYFRQKTEFEVQGSVSDNNLDIHYGMLLPPLYIPGYNNLMNRAMLSKVMAHELGHIIYMILDGRLDDNKIFLEKKQCIWDQFSRFKFENLNEYLNGPNYDTENFPDTVVTTMLDKVIEQHSSMQFVLPGLSYSTKQLFYMTSVQASCAKSNLERELFYTKDSHAPNEIRLQASMQNSRGFPEAFQCPDGSYMNPESKCSLLDTI